MNNNDKLDYAVKKSMGLLPRHDPDSREFMLEAFKEAPWADSFDLDFDPFEDFQMQLEFPRLLKTYLEMTKNSDDTVRS